MRVLEVELEWVDVGGALMVRRVDGLVMDGALKEAVRAALLPEAPVVVGASGQMASEGSLPPPGPGAVPAVEREE